MSDVIPYNKPFVVGKELYNIAQAVIENGRLSGDGDFTHKCQNWLVEKLDTKKALLTHSCTAALEMSAILADIQIGDEIIMPSYTFVSTAIAFIRQGAKIIFADSRSDHPGIDEDKIEALITPKRKAIVWVAFFL